MRNKFGTLTVLLLTLVFVLSACGGNESPSSSAEQATQVPAAQLPATQDSAVSEPDTELVPTYTPEPAGAEQEIMEPTDAPFFDDAVEEPFVGFILADVGFATPESVLYDSQADVYLVSNINGSPSAADGNGFISRLSPTGEVLDLKWIDGAADGVTLDAPKGMAISGDELWVSDITVIRIFESDTGRPVGEVSVPDASFLNDVAAAPDGTIWVSDSNTDKLYRLNADRSVVEIATISGINGVAFREETPLVTSGTSILSVSNNGVTSEQATVPSDGLDGLVVLSDGRLVVSSWSGSNLYLITDGTAEELVGDINAPADIGFDTMRGLILIPHFRNNIIQALPVP